MKKRLIVILSLIVALLPANGQLAIVNDSTMFISQQVDSLTEAERYFNPLFLVVAKGKEQLKQQLVRGSICDCDTTLPNRHIGVFSVAPNKQVTFSQGNLQYFPAANIYKFADNQYDILGNANKYFSPAFRNWVDLFEWSSTSTSDFVDWGTNWICSDKPDTWRTLSKDEWDYLLYLRPNADNLRTKATVDGIGGMILLPDNWNTSTNYSLQKVKDNETLLPNVNMFTPAEWVILEEAGAVFLPAAGSRTYLPDIKNNIFGGYWSSTPRTTNQSYCYSFHVQQIDSYTNFSYCFFGRSVRLVKDTIVEKPEYIQPPKRIGIFSVAADKLVSFSQGNLQYIQSTDTWQFANNQLKYMGYNHYRNGQLADTIEYFGWSAKNSKAPWGISLSTELADYEGEFLDWGTNIIAGDTANTWRTLSNDEWNYICKGRKNAANLLGFGKIDTTSGLIILPDDWVAPDGIIFTPNTDNPDANPYNLQQWTAMENAGAVFIPPTGYFNHKMDNMRGVHQQGYYRNSTLNQDGRQTYTSFTIRDALPNNLTGWIHYSYSGNNQGNLFYAFPVRLVHDTIVPETIPEPSITFEVNGVQYKMIYVEGGNFMMGSAEDDEVVNQNLAAKGDELPQHKVTLDSYYIGEIEVTQKLWKDIMGTDVYDLYRNLTHQGPEPNVVGDNYPIYYMYTSDMIEFTRKLSKVTGLNFRLPTEAEWEYAARGGNKSKGYLYAGSNNVDDVAWYNGNTNYKGVQLVAQKLPNELGIYDMSGNVLERCLDYLEYNEPYSVEAVHNPRGRISQYGNRAYRGGSWNMHKDSVRVTHRAPQTPTFTSTNVGARLVINNNHHFQTFCVNNVWFDMIFVKGDSSLSDYYIGQIEVTQALWRAVMGNAPGTIQDKNLPVDKVSWNDCQVFIHKLNQLTGYHFRLPTEAEWEYAARGGEKSKGYEYAGSDLIGDVAWYQSNSNNAIHTFAKKLPNELGIYDMSGNVWEWCQDYYDTDETMHVVKSGSFYDSESACRIDSRTGRAADYKSYIGLRLVLHDTVPIPPEPEYVDLGLSVKWATFNVGATSPEDYGDYFAWGEIEPKEEYKWENYKWCNATQDDVFIQGNNIEISEDKLTKYNAADGLITLLPEDDAATANWGHRWRMPTRAECQELIDNCNWEKTTLNGVIGYRITGPNNNSIFLPEAGYKYYENFPRNCGSYWPANGKGRMAHSLHWSNPNKSGIVDGRKYCGVPIRPVYSETPDPCLVVNVNDTLSFNMMCVEGGTFTMGDDDNAHPVSLSSYSIGQTEVTQALWEAVMGTNPSANTANKQLPITNISWFDCQEFIKKLNQLTGMRFRLPTEAEWEYAARGGQKSKGYTYAGSNDLKEVAWYNGNSGNTLHAVAQKKPNELGIYDMSGNVWEWCHDWYASYPTTHQYNPLGPEVGQVVGKRYIRIFRGGSYGYAAAYHQNTFRDITGPEPDKGTANLGLRLVLSDEVNFQTIHVNDTFAFHMMDVKGGTFMMGADKAEVNPELAATPVHPVTLSDYYVGETQITQVLWMTIMGTSIRDELEKGGGDYLGEGDDYPMYAISWYDCQEFISKLNQQTGLQFSMPTEAEWEYAARGGQLSRGYQYAGSDNLDEVAWHTGNSKKIGDKVAVSPVKLKKPNELGLYDMTGNIWEWCLDREYLYTPDPQTNPLFSRAGNQLAIIRGGSTYGWGNDSYYVYYRFPYNASTKRTRVGLRLVLHDTVPIPPEPEYVDLGLSVKWATFNVGATSPEDYGDYFAWGETEPKETYSWATYKWCDGTENTMTKYCSDSLYDNADYKTTLDPEDDAAIVRLGGNWRMPAKEEWMELKQKCTWERITINGITGYQVTGKNGNSIFLPRAGLRIMKKPHAADSVGYYASSSHISKYKKENFFYFMRMCDSIITISSGLRYYGYPIRPVYDDRPDPCLVVNVNDTLSFNMMCVEGGTFMMGANNDP